MYYFWASFLIETSFIFLIYLENAKKNATQTTTVIRRVRKYIQKNTVSQIVHAIAFSLQMNFGA